MHKFEYEIRLNDLGAPFVYLSEDSKIKSEDKFMVLEITRGILINILKSVDQKKAVGAKTISDKDAHKIMDSYNTITQLADEIGLLLKAQREINDQLDELLNPKDEE